MTCRELIQHLSTMPQDAVVVFDMYSECQGLEADEVTVQEMFLHNGTWMNRRNARYAAVDQPVKMEQVIHFPGN